MKIAIIGAGGFARELAWLIRDLIEAQGLDESRKPDELLGFLASTKGAHDSEALGDFSWLENNECDALAMGIGTPATRLKLAAELKSRFPHLKWPALVHPSAKYDYESCKFGEGAIVCSGNIFTVNVHIKPFALVNLSCTIGHESQIGDGVVINPLCAISGGVVIGKGCLIGTHASILQYVTIGENAIIGAAAMVNKDVTEGVTAVGVPAKGLSNHSPVKH